ncbi:MAG: amidohydrolase family protein [Candidatus Omnitrophota bacterium]
MAEKLPPYEDHIGLWKKELKNWIPDTIFDAHVHLGPPEIVRTMSVGRRKEPLSTFTDFTWETAAGFYRELYSGKKIAGLLTFGFPQQEVLIDKANDYIAKLIRGNPGIKGFILSEPQDIGRTIEQFEKAKEMGVRFYGVKPYFDRLGKSNYETTMPEFIPEELLRFMDKEKLVMMLHTSGLGMSEPANQEFINSVVEKYPRIKIILAHMGRYLEPKQFLFFLGSTVLDSPYVFLEMSSATSREVYEAVLGRRDLWTKLLFGSDVPFGLITGKEYWSSGTDPTFLTRSDYTWTDPRRNKELTAQCQALTYNTYHVIKDFKDALEGLNVTNEEKEELKQNVFLKNCLRLFGE